MKRFYKMVSVQSGLDGYGVFLDGKSVRTPLKNLLVTTHEPLAQAVMAEWAKQIEIIDVPSMRLTQILSTRIDQVSTERAAMAARLMPYLDTDLLCYRTDFPPVLGQQQSAVWDPWLDWFTGRFSTPLMTTLDLEALRQPPALHDLVSGFINSLDDDHFTVLQIIVPATGSLVLGLAFVEGAITAEEAFAAIRVEENYKAALYNEALHGSEPAQEKKDLALLADLKACAEFLSLLG